MAGTGYSDDDLRVNSGTEPEEVLDFLERRTKNPVEVNGVTVFNYSTHTIDEPSLRTTTKRLYRDAYLIPFQLGPVWAFMYYHLPKRIREIEYLQYDTRDGSYNPHTNFMRKTTIEDNEEMRDELAEWVGKNTTFQNGWDFQAEATPMDRYL